MKYKSELIAAACVAALAFGPASLSAAGKKKSEASTSASPAEAMASPTAPAARAIPFHGKVSAVDQTAKTFTVGKSVFKVSDRTAIVKGTTTGTISDITAMEQVSGAYWKMPDGTMEAKTVKVGAIATGGDKAMSGEKKMKKSMKSKKSASPEASPEASPMASPSS